MRGLLHGCYLGGWELGITPAHAGLTLDDSLSRNLLKDHPRACGAYQADTIAVPGASGSPPRMRGLLIRVPKTANSTGITPAHAGLTP